MNCCKSEGKETLDQIVVNGFRCLMIRICNFIRMHRFLIVCFYGDSLMWEWELGCRWTFLPKSVIRPTFQSISFFRLFMAYLGSKSPKDWKIIGGGNSPRTCRRYYKALKGRQIVGYMICVTPSGFCFFTTIRTRVYTPVCGLSSPLGTFDTTLSTPSSISN